MFTTYDLLPSASRTAITDTRREGSNGISSIRLFLDVTVASGTGGLIPQLRAHDPQTNAARLIWSIPIPVKATGTYIYEMSPGANDSGRDNQFTVKGTCPLSFSVTVTPDDASAYTYSLTAELTGEG